jgi:serine/threonine-protein kinase
MSARPRPIRFGKYVLVEKLAQGGMAEIFRAVLTGPSAFVKTVALKRILPGFGDLPDFRDRFISEARLAADLTHSNIVQVLEFGEIDGRHYLSLEFVDGMDAERLLRRAREKGERMTLAAAFIVAEAARGLAYAHGATQEGKPLGLVHRDVSPQNIMISYSGEVKLTDFGIAKVSTSYHHKTASGAVMGKLRYMSPEQVSGWELDGRSDIFALGLVLWELIVGKRLLDADSPAAVVDEIKDAQFDPPSAQAEDVPPELDRIVARALDPDRITRYQTADEMARDLERFLRAHPRGFGREDLADMLARLAPRQPEESRPDLKLVLSDLEEVPPEPAAPEPPVVEEPAPRTGVARDATPLPPPMVPEESEAVIFGTPSAAVVPVRRRRWVLPAVGAALGVAVVVVLVVLVVPAPFESNRQQATGDRQQATGNAGAVADAPAAAAPAAAPVPDAAAAPAPAAVADAAPAPAPVAEAPRRKRLDGKVVVLDTDSLVDLGLGRADLDGIGRARGFVARADGLLADGNGAGAEKLFTPTWRSIR